MKKLLLRFMSWTFEKMDVPWTAASAVLDKQDETPAAKMKALYLKAGGVKMPDGSFKRVNDLRLRAEALRFIQMYRIPAPVIARRPENSQPSLLRRAFKRVRLAWLHFKVRRGLRLIIKRLDEMETHKHPGEK